MGSLARMLAVLAGVGLVVPSAATALELDSVGTFDQPIYVTSDPQDSDRLFVVERPGRIQLKEGTGTPVEFIDITDRVSTDGERGLFSMAFSPDFETSGLFYVFYTLVDNPATVSDNELGDLRVSEFSASGDDADEGSEREILTIEHSSASNHNGGQLQLGPDGYLYASTGDGGGGGDPADNAQDTGSLLGKLLRTDPAQSGSDSYTVPADNPFSGDGSCADGQCDEIWSYGLRNPWRFSFDRVTEDLVIGDVGQGSFEEVDFRIAPNAGRASNFGWDCREGAHDYPVGPPSVSPGTASPLCPGRAGTFADPVFEYANDAESCTIIGGYVVRDSALPGLLGRYLYVDRCAGELRSLCPSVPLASGDRSEGLTVDFPTSFGEDSSGRIYVVEGGGPVFRLTGTAAGGACPSSPPGPPGPPAPQPPDPDGDADVTPPNLDLDAKRRHDIGDSRVIKVIALVDEPAEVGLRAKVGLGSRALKLGAESASVNAGDAEKLKWKLTKREARRVRRRLARGRRSKARIKGQATDPAGNAGERESVKIRLGR